MKRLIIAAIIITVTALSGCTADNAAGSTTEAASQTYTQITQDKAKEIMSTDENCIIVDVRRQDEFGSGHIPGAICIPNESIGSEMPAELPDTHQVILVYCRSGRRSKQAAQKLADIGYDNVYEFGGIIDWVGETVKD